jgi:hypothetical protein
LSRYSRLLQDLIPGSFRAAENAAIMGDSIAISVHSSSGFQIHLLKAADTEVLLTGSVDVHGEVTCLHLCAIGGQTYILVGILTDGETSISAYIVTVGTPHHTMGRISLFGRSEIRKTTIESLTSLVAIVDGNQAVVLGGTRGGYLVTLEMSPSTPVPMTTSVVRLGLLPVTVSTGPDSDRKSAFVCGDSGLLLLADYRFGRSKNFRTRDQVLPVDLKDPRAPSVRIDSISRLPLDMLKQSPGQPLLMVSNSRVFIAELQTRPSMVPWPIQLNGTPMRVIYSDTLQCLVVAISQQNKPTLVFIDPDTGDILSRPTDRTGESREFASGFGQPGDKITDLQEWIYRKDGKLFLYILVTTDQGRLLIVSTDSVSTTTAEGRREIRYWTRYKKKLFGPVFSVHASGDDIFFCVQNMVNWETMDPTEKRLVPRNQFELPSPAIVMKSSSGKLWVLTAMESLIVLDLGTARIKLADNQRRPSSHMIDLGYCGAEEAEGRMMLLSDRTCGVTGLWVTPEAKADQTVLFEGELPACVRRFRHGHTRPPWWQRDSGEPRYGHLPSGEDGREMLGLCLDGSIQHFTMLSMEAWRFLALIQNLARRSSSTPVLVKRVPAQDDPAEDETRGRREDVEPKEMPKLNLKVDGDVLQRCLETRNLEQLVDLGSAPTFKNCLDQLDGGKWTRGFEEEADGQNTGQLYFDLAYDILEYFLTPVL